jgi:NADH:ubiquinone oxidoreductase subunit 5 (subunit L)/multisubunit Na+/H+ antiporter MnhA subunit
MGVTFSAAVFGFLHAALRRRAPAAPGPWDRWGAMLYVFVLNRGYVDEVYQAVIVRPVLGFAKWLSESVDVGIIDRAFEGLSGVLDGFGKWLSESVDVGFIDRAFEGFGVALEGLGKWLSSSIEGRGIDRAVDGFGAAVAGVGGRMRQMQSGQFHHYAIVILLGAILLLGVCLAAGVAG